MSTKNAVLYLFELSASVVARAPAFGLQQPKTLKTATNNRGNVGARPNMFTPPRDHRLLAVVEAIETIAPSGFAGIRAKARNIAINKHLVANGKDEASDSTILRALRILSSSNDEAGA